MKKNSFLLITIMLAALLSACELTNVKFGEVRMMYGTNEAGRISYDISTFTGIERGQLQAQAGQQDPLLGVGIVDASHADVAAG